MNTHDFNQYLAFNTNNNFSVYSINLKTIRR